LVEKQRQDAIKKLKPSPPRESYQDTVEKMGDTAKASSERLSIPQQNAGNEIVKNLGQGSTSCSGSSSKTSSKTSTPAKEKETSFWDWVFGSDTPEPPKPIEQKSETYWKAKAAQGSTYE
jgi:hypothetical protein